MDSDRHLSTDIDGGSLLCLLSIVVEKVVYYADRPTSDSRSKITLLVFLYSLYSTVKIASEILSEESMGKPIHLFLFKRNV